jgi:YaaC-like Protein
MSDILRIRATRASPFGLARDDPDRRAVYGAALGQFQELMNAASGSSAASRPLPLFYALSQAGRAIAADRADDPWQLRMHGLGTPDLDGEIVDVSVCRHQSKDNVDSFAGVARATGDVPFEGAVTIGALWSSLPEIFELLPASYSVHAVPLPLVPDSPTADNVRFLTDAQHVYATIVGFDGTSDELVKRLAADYPGSGDAQRFAPQGITSIQHHTDYGSGFMFRWEAEAANVNGHLKLLERIAPGGIDFQPRWLRPSVGGIALSSLLSWWTLLFGLSMLARYEPAGWADALDVESSELAVPLEELLDIALDRVPELIFDALSAEQA